jgi:hypothetical protein
VRQKELHLTLGGIAQTATHSIITLASGTPKVKPPSDNAFRAWRIRKLLGIENQDEIAETMSEQLGRQVNQGSVSRWLPQVEAFLSAGGTIPPPTPRAKSAKPMDPGEIDMGERQDGRRGSDKPDNN